ncbi:hypothetical protein BC628DRAFT_932972 [Trametes gibbosa]|nr:hypothetical protein BC628DRAFT_932972 [Trametes gibbosa]
MSECWRLTLCVRSALDARISQNIVRPLPIVLWATCALWGERDEMIFPRWMPCGAAQAECSGDAVYFCRTAVCRWESSPDTRTSARGRRSGVVVSDGALCTGPHRAWSLQEQDIKRTRQESGTSPRSPPFPLLQSRVRTPSRCLRTIRARCTGIMMSMLSFVFAALLLGQGNAIPFEKRFATTITTTNGIGHTTTITATIDPIGAFPTGGSEPVTSVFISEPARVTTVFVSECAAHPSGVLSNVPTTVNAGYPSTVVVSGIGGSVVSVLPSGPATGFVTTITSSPTTTLYSSPGAVTSVVGTSEPSVTSDFFPSASSGLITTVVISSVEPVTSAFTSIAGSPSASPTGIVTSIIGTTSAGSEPVTSFFSCVPVPTTTVVTSIFTSVSGSAPPSASTVTSIFTSAEGGAPSASAVTSVFTTVAGGTGATSSAASVTPVPSTFTGEASSSATASPVPATTA